MSDACHCMNHLNERAKPAPPTAAPAAPDYAGRTCYVCRQPYPGKVDQFGQHDCPGFGRLSCCGVQSETRSGAGHVCRVKP